MSARKTIANALSEALVLPAHFSAVAALKALTNEGYAVVKLPDEDPVGTYSECSIEGGDEIAIDRPWVNPRQARILAADLLRAADQIDAIQAAES